MESLCSGESSLMEPSSIKTGKVLKEENRAVNFKTNIAATQIFSVHEAAVHILVLLCICLRKLYHSELSDINTVFIIVLSECFAFG